MAHGAPAPSGFTSEQYFALVSRGELRPDDRVELLEGVIVSMSPIHPPHAAATGKVADALRRAFGAGVVVRVQSPLHTGPRSVPQPDVAVVEGTHDDYADRHPTAALLVVEVSDTTLAQDRLTKAAVYAAAGIPQYLVVNLRDRAVEVFTEPQQPERSYGRRETVARGDVIALVAKPGTGLRCSDLLPRP